MIGWRKEDANGFTSYFQTMLTGFENKNTRNFCWLLFFVRLAQF